jgi:hypothetical protein
MSSQPPCSENVGWQLDTAVSPGATLNQGDLVRFPSSEDALRRAGIVVTADCDLKNKKHARLVTLAPIVTVEVILERCLLVEDCERKMDLIEAYVFKEFGIDPSRDRDVALASLEEQVSSKRESSSEIALFAAELILGTSQEVRIGEHRELMAALGLKTKAADSLIDSIRKRGDLMVLPNPKSLGIEGSIAWVRQVWQVPQSDIALRTSEVAARPGERVARLDSPYRYRLTQLLAQMFSDIGLPDVPDDIATDLKDIYGPK